MEFLKCKSVIALVVMILGVSYISASDNVASYNQDQDSSIEVSENV